MRTRVGSRYVDYALAQGVVARSRVSEPGPVDHDFITSELDSVCPSVGWRRLAVRSLAEAAEVMDEAWLQQCAGSAAAFEGALAAQDTTGAVRLLGDAAEDALCEDGALGTRCADARQPMRGNVCKRSLAVLQNVEERRVRRLARHWQTGAMDFAADAALQVRHHRAHATHLDLQGVDMACPGTPGTLEAVADQLAQRDRQRRVDLWTHAMHTNTGRLARWVKGAVQAPGGSRHAQQPRRPRSAPAGSPLLPRGHGHRAVPQRPPVVD